MQTLSRESQESKREQLERYIRESRKTQRQLIVVCALGAIVSIVVWKLVSSAGMWALLITAFTGGIGYYITAMHIQGWEHELYELRREARRRARSRGQT